MDTNSISELRRKGIITSKGGSVRIAPENIPAAARAGFESIKSAMKELAHAGYLSRD